MNNAQALKRLVMAHMLFEDQFYVDGKTSAELLKNLVRNTPAEVVAKVALEARSAMKLRHVPLLLILELVRNGQLKDSKWLTDVIQRPDEITELMSLYWGDKRTPISNKVKAGLAAAFCNFNKYSFAKYNRRSDRIKLRDVMFMVHPKPQNEQQAKLFAKIASDTLETPDTWEVALSAGNDKVEVFSRLIKEGKLGGLAMLRNIRNMEKAGVSENTINKGISTADFSRVLPFRFISAYKHTESKRTEQALENAMLDALQEMPKLPGRTCLLVDVSGSMFNTNISAKSDLERFDAAAALAMLARSVCEETIIYTFSSKVAVIDSTVKGFELVSKLRDSQPHASTNLFGALSSISSIRKFDRTIVFTDEVATDTRNNATHFKNLGKGYTINVSSYDKGALNITPSWTTITGFSEQVLEYIRLVELT